MKIQSFQLPNKLKVFLLENHKAPVVTIQSWVRTGSADEQTGQEGLSHFIEHLLFKGTKKYKVGEIAQVIEGAGGDLNAYTSFDQTVFYMTLSSQYADLGLDAMSEMMGEPLFDKHEVDSEREVVIEEIKRTQDNPSRRSSYQLFSSVYETHPYNRPVIGYTEVVKNTPAEKIKKLYFERYCPENMFLLVVGDFKAAEMKLKIQKYFGGLRGKLRKVKRPQEKSSGKLVIALEKAKFQESFLNLAWPTFSATEEERIALDLFSYLLAHGDNTRLVQSLRLQKPVVNEIGAFEFVAQDPGFFSLAAHFDFPNLGEILEKTADEILLLLTENVDISEITKAVNQIESSEFYQETMDAFARQIGNYQFMYNDPNHFAKYLKQLKKIKPEQIAKVIKKFLDPAHLKISLVYPEKEESPRALLETWAKDFALGFVALKNEKPATIKQGKAKRAVDAPSIQSTVKEAEVFKTSSGAKIIFQPLPETGVVSIRAGFLGGLRADLPHKEGGFELLSRVWATGTQEKTEEQIADIQETNNSSVHAFSGRNSFGLQMYSLNSVEQEVGDLFKEVLLKPKFGEKEFEREKEVLKRHIENLVDHPSSLVFSDFLKALFGEHPYAHETHGTAGSIADVSAKDLRKLYDNNVGSANMTFVVAGGIDTDYWKQQIEQITTQLAKGQRFDKKFDLSHITEPKKVYREVQKEQSHIVYGFRGISIFDEDRHALQVLQTMLSGQGGSLFINLRDKASLAYSVSPVRMDGVETGYFGAYIGCSPEKGTRAIEMLKEEFETRATKRSTAQEIERAQQNIIGKQDISLQKTSNITANILFDEIYGIRHLTPSEFREKIMAVTANDVLKVSQKLFTQDPVMACAGAICPWER